MANETYNIIGNSAINKNGISSDGECLWTRNSSGLRVERIAICTREVGEAIVKSSSTSCVYPAYSSKVGAPVPWVGSINATAVTNGIWLKEVSTSYKEGPLVAVRFVWETSSDSDDSDDGSTEDDSEKLSNDWSLEWADVTKPIEQAAIFSEVLSNSYRHDDDNGLSGFDIIARIKEAPASKQKNFQYRNPLKAELEDSDSEAWKTLGDGTDEENAIRKYFNDYYWRGIDSYLESYPVLRHTRAYDRKPFIDTSTYGKGEIRASTGYVNEPSGYKWRHLTSLSHDVIAGRYILTDTYTGANEWSTDLYGEAK